MLFILNFLSLKHSMTQSHLISNKTFASPIWNLLQENKFMLPVWFQQAMIWLVEIEISKPMCPAVSSRKDCRLISRTAAGSWAYFACSSYAQKTNKKTNTSSWCL